MIVIVFLFRISDRVFLSSIRRQISLRLRGFMILSRRFKTIVNTTKYDGRLRVVESFYCVMQRVGCVCVVCDRYFWVVCVVFLCRMSLVVCVVIVVVCVWWVVVNVVGCSYCLINIILQVLYLVVVADICYFGSFYNDSCNLFLWIGIFLWQKEIKIIELLYDGSDEGFGGVIRGWSCYMLGGRGFCFVIDFIFIMIRLLYVLY